MTSSIELLQAVSKPISQWYCCRSWAMLDWIGNNTIHLSTRQLSMAPIWDLLHCPVVVRARGTSRVPDIADCIVVDMRWLWWVCRGLWGMPKQRHGHTSRRTRPSWRSLVEVQATSVSLQELGSCDHIGAPQTQVKQTYSALTSFWR